MTFIRLCLHCAKSSVTMRKCFSLHMKFTTECMAELKETTNKQFFKGGIIMEMTSDGMLVMPSSYAVMNEEEMTYMDGGDKYKSAFKVVWNCL